MIAVEHHPPGTDAWRRFVSEYLDDFLTVVAESYGADDRGARVHRERVLRTEPWLFAARLDTGVLAGASYVHRSGKRGVTAVAPLHRGKGIGEALVAQSVLFVPDQWTEVAASNAAHTARLAQHGFRPVFAWEEVEKLLGPLLSPLVVSRRLTAQGITYSRTIFDSPHIVREFQLLSRGEPMPRRDNDGRFYRVEGW